MLALYEVVKYLCLEMGISVLYIYVKGRPCGSVAQLAECSHGKREAETTRAKSRIFFVRTEPRKCMTLRNLH